MCLITAGYQKGSACNDVRPGIKWDQIWIGNKSEITFGAATNKRISSITLDTGKTLFKLDCHRNTASFSDVMQVSENSGDTQMETLTLRIIDDTNTTIEAIENLRGADLIIVARTKGDRFVIVGEDDGCRLTGFEYNTGAKSGDDAGMLLTFTSEQAGVANEFFDTDVATTVTTLDAELV